MFTGYHSAEYDKIQKYLLNDKFSKMFLRNLMKQYTNFFPWAKIRNGQEIFCGVVDDKSPLSEVIESDEEMTQRLASNYLQDDIQNVYQYIISPSTTEFDEDLSLNSLREKIPGTCFYMRYFKKVS